MKVVVGRGGGVRHIHTVGLVPRSTRNVGYEAGDPSEQSQPLGLHALYCTLLYSRFVPKILETRVK
jgi:hypothetical protein